MFETFMVAEYFKEGDNFIESLSSRLVEEITEFSERKNVTEVSRSQPSLTVTPTIVINDSGCERAKGFLAVLSVTSEFKSESV